MSFALSIPDEIHLVMNPQGGWIDLETLFHEMGHALSHAFTSPRLSSAEKDFFTSNTLSETYAFLLQNMCCSPCFLERQLGLSSHAIEQMSFYKALKDLSVFRRYVSKFLSEYEMFKENEVSNGEIYSTLMAKYTGFAYRPETHLFDLVPEFYALDYVISWMAEATMEKKLVQSLGHDWMFQLEAGDILKDWWSCGNKYEIDEFFSVKGIGPIDYRDIVDRWHNKILGEDVNADDSPTDDSLVVRTSV
jgi:oligoendopeptidase F